MIDTAVPTGWPAPELSEALRERERGKRDNSVASVDHRLRAGRTIGGGGRREANGKISVRLIKGECVYTCKPRF